VADLVKRSSEGKEFEVAQADLSSARDGVIGACDMCHQPEYKSHAYHTLLCLMVKTLQEQVRELESRVNANDERRESE
jgi:cytochrome c553